jgi:hypothetical protein
MSDIGFRCWMLDVGIEICIFLKKIERIELYIELIL